MKQLLFDGKPVDFGDKIEWNCNQFTITEELVEDLECLTYFEFPKFVRCIKDVIMTPGGRCAYIKGNLYKSEHENGITDEQGYVGHSWRDFIELFEHFEPISQKEFEQQGLLAEAKKRYNAGDRVKSVLTNGIRTLVDGAYYFYNDNTLCTDCKDGNVFVYRNGKWAEIVERLFITDDGVGLYHPHDAVYICPSLENIHYTPTEQWCTRIVTNRYAGYWMNFSTPEARAKWIEEQTICTTEDGKPIFSNSNYWVIMTGPNNGDSKTIVPITNISFHWKIFNIKEECERTGKPAILDVTNTNTKRFSTKEKAEEWLEDQVVFVSEDGVKMYPKAPVFVLDKKTLEIDDFHSIKKIRDLKSEHDFFNFYFFSSDEAREAYIQKPKEKTLEDYEDQLLCLCKGWVGDIPSFSPPVQIAGRDFYRVLKLNEPKLYWTKVLQLIADDLNGDWKPEIGNKHYFIRQFISKPRALETYDVSTHTSVIYPIAYFASSKKAEKAIKLMGTTNLDIIFK